MAPPPERQPQLICYPDALGGTIESLIGLVDGEMAGWFPGGVHLLPPFPSSGDRGFAPTRYDHVEPEFGSWEDLEALARAVPLTLDVMVNHISRRSLEFVDFRAHGRASAGADMFMRPDKVWLDGDAPDEDLRRLFLRRPHSPFLEVPIGDGDTTEVVWATFGVSEHESEQIDLDWRSPLTRAKYREWFGGLADAGVVEVRLDAVGYLVKEAGTSCFMVGPAIWDALDCLRDIADAVGLRVLPEVHATTDVVAGLDAHGYTTYDFVLPGLMLDALHTRSTGRLAGHLATLAPTRVTMLDCHDGVPISPDLVGIVPEDDLRTLTAALEDRGANINRILGAAERGIDFDVHQINISYLDAADGPDGLAVARAVQLFSPGRPQVYYQGLLGGGNDLAAIERTGEGRAVNRTDYTVDEARHALASPIARRQRRLLEIRSRHPAFAAERPSIARPHDDGITARWDHLDAWCQLDADVTTRTATVTMSPFPGLEPGPV